MFTFTVNAQPTTEYSASILRMDHEIRHREHANYFDQSDISMHMLGMPKSRPQFRTWLLLAILTGTVLALALVLVGNMIF